MTAIDSLKFLLDTAELETNHGDILVSINVPVDIVREIISAQPEDYTEMKREFLRMAGYIDCLLECSDEQKETLIGFISRMAEYMPWTEKD